MKRGVSGRYCTFLKLELVARGHFEDWRVGHANELY